MTTMTMTEDWAKLAAELEQRLRLRAIPFGMKLFKTRAEMEAIPRIRRPQSVHTLDQVVAQAARLGWTVGITAEDLVGAQCRAVVGLGLAKDAAWRSGRHMAGVWYGTLEDASAHQAAMNCVEDGTFEALAVAPLASGRLDPPDIALFYATPGAMIYFINGLQWSGYKRFEWSVVGELACADSWDVRSRRASRASPSPASPSAATAACSTTRCSWRCRPRGSPRRSPAWRHSPRTASATPSRNTASSRTCAPAWR